MPRASQSCPDCGKDLVERHSEHLSVGWGGTAPGGPKPRATPLHVWYCAQCDKEYPRTARSGAM